MTRTLRIVLVDDQDLVRSGFRMILDVQKDMCVVGQASDSIGVLPMAKVTQPDIVLMDIRMPTLDGISAIRAVLGSHPDLKALILTTSDLDDYLVAAVRAGVLGFPLEDSAAHRLLAGIRVVVRGDPVVTLPATRRLLKRWLAPAGSIAGPVGPLEPGVGTAHIESIDAPSDREKEVVTLVGRAMSNTEIAQHLVLVESTIKPHPNRILHKLELHDRAQLIVLAYESGLMRVGE